ncbi:conserved membrane hypothetical protein [Gammaproteobacteria bacterium]
MSAFGEWLLAFAVSQAIEVPIYLYATRGRWYVSVLASTWTHPIVWFVFPLITPLSWGWVGMVEAAELFAVLVEASWLAYNKIRHALGWSLISNAASLGLGLMFRNAWDWP